MAEYEKVKRITIPLENNNLLLITVEVEADHTNIINQILDDIKNYSYGIQSLSRYTSIYIITC